MERRARPVRRGIALASIASVLLAGAALAQTEEEDDEWRERDRRYLERLERRDRAPAADPSDPAAREAARDAIVERAEALLRGPSYRSKSTAGHAVRSDDLAVDVRAAASLLDAFARDFERFWSGRRPLAPLAAPGDVSLFASFRDYNELLTGSERLGDFRPAGHYRGRLDLMLLYTGSEPRSELADTLVHEAAHRLVTHRLLGPETAQPPWLAEGLASYFGFTLRTEDGRFEFGKVGPKTAGVTDAGRPAKAKRALREARRALRRDPAIVDRVLRLDSPAVFYGEGAALRYAVAWVTVHYLLHGEGGAHADGFDAYLARLVAGDPPAPETLYAAVGLTSEALAQGVRTWVKSMRSK